MVVSYSFIRDLLTRGSVVIRSSRSQPTICESVDQVHPACTCFKIGYIIGPNLLWGNRVKVLVQKIISYSVMVFTLRFGFVIHWLKVTIYPSVP
ncbi:hypothetical protein F0255_17700 [Vibrio coralliilyticus]|nr:hypothetical protein [Vibrio coralliilyticus]NOI49753.1 hypothetical protein [Vibrio coralliilyticus]